MTVSARGRIETGAHARNIHFRTLRDIDNGMLDELRRRTGVSVAGLPSLPARAHCRGIDFLEFAMDESAGAKFEVALKALGFAKAGVHKSKMVTRWRQGDINPRHR
jgi:hypothetical protein